VICCAASLCGVPTLSRLVGTRVGAQCHRFARPGRPREFPLQDFGNVDLGHDLGVEAAAGIESSQLWDPRASQYLQTYC